jgi:hypothetical protein
MDGKDIEACENLIKRFSAERADSGVMVTINP